MVLHKSRILFLRTLLLTLLLAVIAQAQETVTQLKAPVTPKYVDLGPQNVNAFKINYGLPQVGEYTIETLGYSEIRFFVNVFVEKYKSNPIKNAKINMRFFNNVQGGSWDYADYSTKSVVTSYIQGWTTQKIYGKSTRVWVWAENMPPGPYTITVTYYLIP